MKLTFSVRFNNDVAPAEFARLAALAEEGGFDQVWVSNDLFFHSAPVLVTAAAQATSRIELGVGVFNPVSMHASEIAMVAASLAELTDGRALLGIGAVEEGTLRNHMVTESGRLRRFRRRFLVLQILHCQHQCVVGLHVRAGNAARFAVARRAHFGRA